ncbi:diguanylate cyclase [Alkalimonas collagenimarina]|uniref:diguanylate cyclase n=1 Tax=Alkalimonas collagenimarina TaxID=400390 RepID=A0ABT9GY66_9GAMM|nr:ligand-binding sensor domain-containing diguanylate cyclase [Alkalimonas collagenimarina]MDP4535997.1 diguanylate cyclase [Alkalimonas collagenimarina]
MIAFVFCLLAFTATAQSNTAQINSEQNRIAQRPTDSLQHYFREQWTTRDGLPHNTINNMAQTDDGYLWFATWEGIARFNGRSFKVFDRNETTGLPDSGIFALHAAANNRLLAGGSRGGLVALQNERWQPYPVAGALIRSVLEDSQGRIWLATEGAGLWRQEPDGQRYRITSAKPGLSNEAMFSLAEDNTGTIWVGTAEGLFFIKHDLVQHVSAEHGLPEGPVFSIAMAYQDQVVVGTEQGVFIGDKQHGFHLLDNTLTMASSALLVDDDQLWIGTVSDGLFRFNQSGVEALGTDTGKPNNRILSLLKDQQGSLWVGTNGGLFRLRHAPFSSFNHEHGLADDFVRAVLPLADGSVLVGTSRGVDRIDNYRAKPFEHSLPLLRESILSLAQDASGTLWFGSYAHGLFSVDATGETQQFTREQGLWTNEVRAILPADDGSLWIGTSRGLNRWYQGSMEQFDVDSGLPGNYIMALYQTADQRIWVGTGSGVAYRHNDGFTTVDLQQQDEAEFAFGFLEVQHHLWMATDRGLVRYDQNSGQLAIIGRQAGLPFDKYFQVVLDQQEHLWLTSNRGMLRFALADANALLDGSITHLAPEHYNEADGMHSAQANGGSNPAATLHPDGSVWVATAGGAIRTQPSTLGSFSDFIPPIVIEDIRVDGETSTKEALQSLPAGTQRIELHYAGLAYVMSQHIRYRTRLQGFDQDWIERGNQPYTELTNLPPGQYTFEVIAAYPNGEWSPQPAMLAIHIAPYLWQRTGFWFTVVLFGVLAVIGLVRWRLYSLQQAATRLQQQVAEKTIELQLKADHLQQSNHEKSLLVEQLRIQSEAFARQARQDSLTGLANRRVFDEALSQEFKRAKRHQHPLCLVLIDLDHFKRVNDNWSHAVGDQVLIRVAASLQEQCRDTDIVSRWGGEEFALLLPETGLPEVMQFCDRLRAQIRQLDFSDVAADLQITISIGVADSMHCEQPETLLSQADKALYQAKDQGRDQVSVAGT